VDAGVAGAGREANEQDAMRLAEMLDAVIDHEHPLHEQVAGGIASGRRALDVVART
jgi:hypothetical protein